MEGVGRATRGQECLLRVYSEPGLCVVGLCAQQPRVNCRAGSFSVALTKRGFRQSWLSFLHSTRPHHHPPFPSSDGEEFPLSSPFLEGKEATGLRLCNSALQTSA